MTEYVLKANFKGETLYYMNIICVTGQVECAESYSTKEEAMKDIPRFEILVRGFESTIKVVDKAEEMTNATDKHMVAKWGINV